MNKLRRDPPKPGGLKGNMMGYPEKAEPKTSHVAGGTPGNMMGYSEKSASRELNQDMPSYGNKPLAEPTRSGFDSKTIPEQNKNWKGIDPTNPEWLQVQSVKKKKGAFYG